MDLGPTVQELAGVETPDAAQGDSLVPYLAGEETDALDGRVALATSADGDELCARTHSWKCLWDVETDDVKLFDLDADPSEERDVSDKHPDRVAELAGHIEAYLDDAEATEVDLPTVAEGEEVKQRLRDLGYVD